MRVVRAAGQNVSPSDDGRLFDQIFSDGLFTDTTFTNLGGNTVQVGAMYGDLCGRDFTVEQMTLTVTLPEGEGEVTGYIYVEIDTSSDDVITLNSALAPFTPTYEDINTNGAIAQMILAEYTATAVAVTGVTPVFKKVAAGAVRAGSVATVETAQATQNHSVGEYILLDKQLYIVTAAVSAGETFVEGTNISATSIGGELKALNNGLNIQTVTGTDGTAVKFPDGTMIFHGFKTVALSTSAMTVHVTFPVRFNGAPSVTESTGAGGTRTEAYIEDVNDVGFNAYFNARSATSTSWLRYIAIGRWK